jgi:hypothetical protein
MKIETRYDVGDIAYFHAFGDTHECIVRSISADVSKARRLTIQYRVSFTVGTAGSGRMDALCVHERELYPTREDAEKAREK